MKSLNQYIREDQITPINTYIDEGLFSWLKGLFKRTKKFKDNYKKRFGGKLPDISIDDIDELQVSKPIKGNFEKADLKDLQDSGFPKFTEMNNHKDKFFVDKDRKEIKPTTLTYVYTPKNSLSVDEKYISAVASYTDISLLDNYVHVICFEVSDKIKNAANISKDLFKLFIDKYIRDKNKSADGITIKYIHNINDFTGLTYNGKKFEMADEANNLIKLTF